MGLKENYILSKKMEGEKWLPAFEAVHTLIYT
jgi:hypothetical protein